MNGRPRGRPRAPHVEAYLIKIKSMRLNASFFVEGAQRQELEFLRAACKSAGLVISMRHVEVDEIYKTAGVRIWRREGSWDEL